MMKVSRNWQHLVRAVGRVSMIELLDVFAAEEQGPVKAADLTRLVLAKLKPSESRKYGLATLELLGNLLQFVPYSEHLAPKLESRAFKLWLEGMERPDDTALCVPNVARLGFWSRAIIEAYG
jgi:hypothetical protein